MFQPLQKLKKQIKRIKFQASQSTTFDIERYKSDPGLYAKERLGITLTSDQEAGLVALTKPPYRVIVRAGHSVGKSTMMAVGVSWIYDTRPKLFGIITAPTEQQIKEVVWRELRKMRTHQVHEIAALSMRSGPDHLFMGITARNTSAFQGKHEHATYVFMDEASGIEPEFFEASETMVGGEEFGQLITLNPLSGTCQAYREERSGAYTVLTMSCLDHPNIPAELAGESPPYPSAVRLQRLIGWIQKWCDPIAEADALEQRKAVSPFTVFAFPKKGDQLCPAVVSIFEREHFKILVDSNNVVVEGQWWKAGPEAESRILGLWPSSGVNSIWSEMLFQKCRNNVVAIKEEWRLAIGCDVARFGDDMTEIAIRRGPCLIHTEAHSGWDLKQTTMRLKQLCHHFPGPENPRKVRVYIDETGGLGSGPVDFADDYNFVGVNVSEVSNQKNVVGKPAFRNIRTELWFNTRDMAQLDIGLDFSRLDQHEAFELEQQLLAQKYDIDPKTGQSFAIDKKYVKEELGRSPDKADAVNLCYFQPGSGDGL